MTEAPTPIRACADSLRRTELIAAVDYRPQVSVEDGVARFVEWYRAYHGGEADAAT